MALNRICRCLCVLAVVLGCSFEAFALIMVGKGNAPVTDRNWPAGALDVANLKTRVGWWEGPPFGGGEWHFLYRGDTKAFEDALARFAKINAPRLEIVVHEGPTDGMFLKDDKNPKADSSVDWELTLWDAQSFHRLNNGPGNSFLADSPNFHKELVPPRLDVYTSPDRVDWSKIKVPDGVTVTDECATSHGYKAEDGSVVRGTVYDMVSSKPIAAELAVEKNAGQKYDKVASATADADGKFEIRNIPAGTYRVVIRADGYAPRILEYLAVTKNVLKTYVGKLAPAVEISGTVADTAGKPLENIKIRPSGIVAMDGSGYTLAESPEAMTDAAGHFSLTGLPKGQISVFAYGGNFFQLEGRKRYEAGATDLKLQMTATGTIRGQVFLANGKPAAGTNVSVDPEGNPIGKWGGGMHVKADGTFQFDNVPPGKYFVQSGASIGAVGKRPESQEVNVRAGETAEVTIQLAK